MAVRPNQEPFDVVELTNKVLKTIDDTAKAVVVKAEGNNHETEEQIARRLGYTSDNDNSRKVSRGRLEKANKIEDYYKKLIPHQRKLAEAALHTNEELEEINKHTSVLETVKELWAKYLPKIFEKLSGQKDISDKLYRLSQIDRRNATREGQEKWWASKSFKERRQLEFQGVTERISSNGPKTEAAVKALTSMSSLISSLGGVVGNGIIKVIEKILPGASKLTGGVTSTIDKGGIIGTAFAVIRVFSKFFIGFSLLLIPITSLFKHTELFGEYMEAFTKLWTEALGPFLKKLNDLAAGLMNWLFGGESSDALDTLGFVINKAIIWFIGEFLPDTFNFIGDLIMDAYELLLPVYDTIKTGVTHIVDGVTFIVNSILGIFGVGPLKDQGFLEIMNNLLKPETIMGWINEAGNLIIQGIGKFLLEVPKFLWGILDSTLTWIIELFVDIPGGDKLSEFILKKLDDLATAWINMMKSIVQLELDAISGAVQWVAEFISQWEFGKKIVDKVAAIFETITNALPSVDDIKAYVRATLESIPGGAWLAKKIFDNEQKEVPPDFQRMLDGMEAPVKGLREQIDDLSQSIIDRMNKIINEGFEKGNEIYQSLPPVDSLTIDPDKIGSEATATAKAAMEKAGELMDESAKKIKDLSDSDAAKNAEKVVKGAATKAGTVIQQTIFAPNNSSSNSTTIAGPRVSGRGGAVQTFPTLKPHDWRLYKPFSYLSGN